MNINRYNYEEYLLLYIDNELNAAERKAVEDFLEINSDLQKELFTLQQTTIRPDKKLLFRNKEALLQSIPGEERINSVNYEQFFFLYADDELTHAEKAEVEDFVYRHPQFQEAFELIQELRLIPDLSLTYPDKKSLYRFEKEKKPVFFAWWPAAAAAMVLLIAGALWLHVQTDSKTDDIIAQTPQRKSPAPSADASNLAPSPVEVTAIPGSVSTNAVKKQSEKLAVIEKNKVTTLQKKAYRNEPEERKYPNDQLASALKPSGIDITVKPEDALPKQPAQTEQASQKFDGLQIPGKLVIDQPVSINELNSPSSNAMYVSTASNDDENTFLTNIPINNRNSFRKVFRKASRLIQKTTDVASGRRSGILIGNVEIAIQ